MRTYFSEYFTRLYKELDMNKKDSKKRPGKTTTTIQSQFEKTSSKNEEETENLKPKTSSSLYQMLKKKFSFSSDSSKTADVPAFTLRFHENVYLWNEEKKNYSPSYIQH